MDISYSDDQVSKKTNNQKHINLYFHMNYLQYAQKIKYLINKFE